MLSRRHLYIIYNILTIDVLDVSVDPNTTEVSIIDINPWRVETQRGLFTWDELEAVANETPQPPLPLFRIVDGDDSIQPSLAFISGLPLELRDKSIEQIMKEQGR